MADLAPKLQSGIQFEEPIETPSLVGGLAKLGGAAIEAGALKSKQPSKGDLKEARNQARLIGLQNALTKAEELSLQGNEDRANRLKRTSLINFLRDGGEINDETKAIIKFTTGEEFDTVALSPQEIAMNQFRESDEYGNLIVASYDTLGADATGEERENWALSQHVRQQGYKASILNDAIGWYDGKQEAYKGIIEGFWHSSLGALNATVAAGGTVSQQDFQSAKASWQALKSDVLVRPKGVTDSDWASTEGQIQAVDETLSYVQSLSGSQGVTTELLGSLSKGIKHLIDSDKITTLDGITLLNLIEKDPAAAVTNFGVTSPTEIHELLKSTTRIDYDPTGDVVVDPEVDIPGEVKEQYKGIDPVTKLEDAKKITKATKGTVGFDLASDKFAQTAFYEYTTKAFGAMNSVSADNSRFASVETINEVFSGEILEGINTIGQTDPVKAQELANRGFEALDSQYAVATSAYLNVVSQLDLDPQNLTVTEDVLVGLGMSPVDIAKTREAANDFFGGDINQMILSAPPARLTKISFALGALKSTLKQATDLRKTMDRFDELRKVFLETGQSFVEVTGGEGQTETGGGEGTDTLTASNGPIAQSLGIDFGAYEAQYGLPAGYLERVAMLESSGNPNAQAEASSAGGVFQFIDSTAKQYGLTNKFDAVASTDAASRLASDNANSLRRALGREPQAWELYLAHQQGAGGAAKLLANPSGRAVDAVGKAAVLNNGGHENMTSGEFSRMWAKKWTKSAGRGPTSRSQATGLHSPTSSPRPQVAPDDLTAVGIDNVRPQARPQSQGEDLSGEVTLAQATTPAEEGKKAPTPDTEPLKIQTDKLLDRLGLDPEDVPRFDNEEDVRKALENGDIGPDDVIILNGQIIVL